MLVLIKTRKGLSFFCMWQICDYANLFSTGFTTVSGSGVWPQCVHTQLSNLLQGVSFTFLDSDSKESKNHIYQLSSDTALPWL